MADKEIVLDVRHLQQYFSNGIGKNKVVVKAVDDVSFQIPKGETFGLVGESGCGKTTTGRTIIRLYKPTGGEVYYKGKLISGKLSHEEKIAVHQGIQMIFQDPISSLNPRMTIQEIIGEGLLINKLVKNDTELRKRCEEMIELVGLTKDHLSRYPHEFSGGQRQRIGIARVLASNPGLIIADEPVSMLDVSVRADIINMLIDLSRNQGAAVLFISHDIALTRYISDYIAVMYLGRVVEYGTADDVIKNPQHPYTKALISNCASIDPEEKVQNIAIEGEPPTPLNPGPGCYFEPRCYCACETCRQSYPEKIVMENGHWATCSRINK